MGPGSSLAPERKRRRASSPVAMNFTCEPPTSTARTARGVGCGAAFVLRAGCAVEELLAGIAMHEDRDEVLDPRVGKQVAGDRVHAPRHFRRRRLRELVVQDKRQAL